MYIIDNAVLSMMYIFLQIVVNIIKGIYFIWPNTFT